MNSLGIIRVRLVSSLFTADSDVHEDPLLTKFETISTENSSIDFAKQFALVLKNTRIGPGPIGKFYLEWLDPSNGSYTSNPPIFELNLNLSSEHEILLTYSHEVGIQSCINQVEMNFYCSFLRLIEETCVKESDVNIHGENEK